MLGGGPYSTKSDKEGPFLTPGAVSIGSLQFLPDIERWARVVAALVAPGGFCYITEPHPLIKLVDDDTPALTLGGDYFDRGAILLDEGTYGNPEAELESPTSFEWIHHTADVVSALGTAGLCVEFLHEHDWIWYPIFPSLIRQNDGRWRFPEGRPSIPLLYSLRAAKHN